MPVTGAARARTHPLALALAQGSTASPAAGDFGLRPRDLHSAYSLPDRSPSAETIALIDAYNDPTLEQDLAAYDHAFALPECTAADGCLRQVGESGQAAVLPFPHTSAELQSAAAAGGAEARAAQAASGWDLEISLDVETAHAVCQNCSILLVEASSESDGDLEAGRAHRRAARRAHHLQLLGQPGGRHDAGAGAVRPVRRPGRGDHGLRRRQRLPRLGRRPNRRPVPGLLAARRGGRRHPAVADARRGSGPPRASGTAAAPTGGGCSTQFTAPVWQQSLADWAAVGCGHARAVADVAAVADPYTGMAVYATNGGCEFNEAGGAGPSHWCTIGGTSLSAPLIAAVFALAGGAGETPYPARLLYENLTATPLALHDVLAGSSASCALGYEALSGLSRCSAAEEAAACSAAAICLAGAGYDGPTGVGTPDGLAAFRPPGARGAEQEAEQPAASAPSGEAAKPPAAAPAAAPGPEQPAEEQPQAVVASRTATAPLSLTRLALTGRRAAARRGPRVQLSFTVTSSAPGPVAVRLYRRARGSRRGAWLAAAPATTITVPAGHSSWQLELRGSLSPGAYRLALAPAHGRAATLSFRAA